MSGFYTVTRNCARGGEVWVDSTYLNILAKSEADAKSKVRYQTTKTKTMPNGEFDDYIADDGTRIFWHASLSYPNNKSTKESNKMDLFEFTNYSAQKVQGEKDISIHIGVSKEGKIRVSFTFRNGSYKKFGEDVKRLDFAVANNLMAFKSVEFPCGWRLSKSKCKQDNRYLQIQDIDNEAVARVVKWCKKYEGEYELKTDDFSNYHYIKCKEASNGNR